jgi:hypothetical protein
MFDHDLADLDAKATLAAARGSVRTRRLDEVAELRVLAHWASLHGSDPTLGPDGHIARRVGDVLVQVGGEGTPWVQDFCLGDIALARAAGVMATRAAIADVLDLRHRLPLTWRRCTAGEAEPWVARKVARLSRHLPLACVHVVDVAVARMIDREAPGRVLAVAEAKVIEADPALHDERVEAERRRRYVGFSRTDEHGLRTLIARLEAGDAAWIQATLTRVVEIIAPRHDDLGADELRAHALAYLARPAELLALLTRAELDTQQAAQAAAENDHPDETGPAEPDDEPDGPAGPSRATAFPADLLEALKQIDLTPLAPKTVLYVHLHQAALDGVPAVARVEGLGPASLAQLRDLIAGTRLTVTPVIDLNDRIRLTAYEHPEALKERVYLTTGGDYWPHSTSTSRHVDYDHPTPYDDTGPPDRSRGQTGTHNSGPLGRRHHRWKTHAGYRARQSGQGRYAWLTPHGLGYLVDHRGTHQIPAKHARMIIEAPMGCDIYPGVRFQVDSDDIRRL